MKSDPFAPAASPNHIKSIRREAALNDMQVTALRWHQTEAERDADQVPDAEELERRITLVQEFRAELDEHGEAENPTLIDLTDTEHVWHYRGADDGESDPEAWGWSDTATVTFPEGDEPAEDVPDAGDTDGTSERTPDETPGQRDATSEQATAGADGTSERTSGTPTKRPRKGSRRKSAEPAEDLDAALAALNEDKGE